MRAPSLPARPCARRSRMVAMAPQHGHRAPLRLMVPAPRPSPSPSPRPVAPPRPSPSPSPRPAAPPRLSPSPSPRPSAPPLPVASRSSSKSTPLPSSRGAIASRTRLPPRLQSQSVFRSGTSARQCPHSAVRAQRYATVGLATQRGLRGSSRSRGSSAALSASTDTLPCASGARSTGERDGKRFGGSGASPRRPLRLTGSNSAKVG